MNFGSKFSFKGSGRAFRSFFVYNMKRNFSLLKSQPTTVNLFNGMQKKTYTAMAISTSLLMSISFLSNGTMTNAGSAVAVRNKAQFLDLLEKLALMDEASIEKSR